MTTQHEVSFKIPRRSHSYKEVFQFRISLSGITPQIWRRIQVPTTFTFYDLHVAIQDAMGWEDRHLHVFEIGVSQMMRIECPHAEPEPWENVQYWTTEVPLKTHFKRVGTSVAYRYDFGDDWLHLIELEGIAKPEDGELYPKCLNGERACPPEDCGGPGGYADCVEALKKNGNKERRAWLGEWRPDAFSVKKVKFGSPRARFLKGFGE
ncbi:MAG: plasmid pRiA4b ORF-3 family protein [Elusimicrobia bacterium]|nr:plasmid pRiA4b ORF-3 family protein [Elusimicrobiota bacterium]